MVTTMKTLFHNMKHFFIALLLLTASAEAQTFGSSTIEITPAALTNVSNVFTPSCPTLGGGFAVENIVVTAASQSIALPASCPGSSVGLFVTFNICNGKSGTVPCNGTATGPFSPGISFGTGFEFPGTTVYAVNSTNGNNVSGAKDLVTCEVMGTTGPWSCGVPQYAMTPISSNPWTIGTHAKAQGANGATTSAINTVGATLFVVGLSYQSGTSPTLSDSPGGGGSATWTQAGSTHTSGNVSNAIYYVVGAPTNASHTFTCGGSSIFCAIEVQTVTRNFGGTTALDQINGNTGSSSPVSTGSITPTIATALVFASCGAETPASAMSFDSGFTTTDEIDFGAGVSYGGVLARLVQGTTPINPGCNWTGGVLNAAATIADFK